MAHGGAAAHAAEDEQIEEVHPAEDQQDRANFYGKRLDAFLGRGDFIAQLECQTDKTEIDQIKADHQKVID